MHNGCGFFINDPFLFILRVFDIPVWGNGSQMFAGFSFTLPCGADLLGSIAGVHFVENIADSGKLILAPGAVNAVIDSNKVYAKLRKKNIHIHTHLQIDASESAHVFLCQVGTKKFLRIYKPFIGGQPPVNGLRFLYTHINNYIVGDDKLFIYDISWTNGIFSFVLAASQHLRDVLHTAHGDACQIHLDEGLLHAALPAAIPLDDGSLEGYALEPRHVERDVTGSGGKVTGHRGRCGSPDGPRCARSGPPASGTPPPFPAASSGFLLHCRGPIP